jgi:hypothetical protein
MAQRVTVSALAGLCMAGTMAACAQIIGIDNLPPLPNSDAGGNPCDLETAPGGTPAGFPYDVNMFNTTILPSLRMTCESGSSCHGAGNVNQFTVYKAGDGSTCPDEQTFNEVATDSDYVQGGAASKIVQKTNGTVTHAFPAAGSMDIATALQAYIDAAKATYDGGGGGGGGGAAAFDAAMFASQIQPVLDNAGCIVSGCHDITGASLGGEFGLTRLARAGTLELQANIEAIVQRIDLTLDPSQATQTQFYMKTQDRHGTTISDATAQQNLQNWIAGGLTNQ